MTTPHPNTLDVPDISTDWYRGIVAFAQQTPDWVQSGLAVLTDGGVIVLLAFVLLAAWRARTRSAEHMALVALAPVGAALAYGVNLITKGLLEERRPCRVLDVDPISECPPPGDWSFPSNHAVVAMALAVGILLTWRRLGIAAILLALVVCYSRVFLGEHYPHDVVVGAMLGAAVSLLVALALSGVITTLVRRLRGYRVTGIVLGPGRSAGPSTGVNCPSRTPGG